MEEVRNNEGRGKAAGTEASTEAADTTTGEEEDEVTDLAFHAGRCTVYHQYRRGFLDACHRTFMFLVIASGGGAVYAITQGSGLEGLLPLIPALFGALDLAFAPSVRARDHQLLAMKFSELMADEFRGVDSRELLARLEILYGEEPPAFNALDALAHNHMCHGIDREHGSMEVPRLHRLLKNVVRFSGAAYPIRDPG